MMDWLEIQFWKVARRIIINGYGCSCGIRDYEDYYEGEPHDVPHELNAKGRCPSCRAEEVVEWIDDHIELLKM